MALNRDNIDQEEDDPLLTNHPNQLMPSIEISIFNPKNLDSDVLNIDEMPSPRLFRTHLPYSKLPESIKNDNSSCKLVYITREPKDVFVSLWHFMNSISNAEPCPKMDEYFDSFCKGIHPFGPFHDHVLEYWNESLKKPEKILFLRYEEIKKDPKGQVKKLAEFLGRPFANEEELDNVLWRCSLERLRNLQVNKNGLEPSLGIPKFAYFRNGLVGDGKNSLKKEMQERLDQITREKFEGTGLDLQVI
uniref:Sulfotransferase n=2 Tax=Nicotiana tabacum TaxID=4097 RepID=A0A1S3Y2E3_TOBAC|nr:PREDICTED: cytosolic sulfotransferase 5-like isoform X1 [Nicotiana tabacum]